MMKLNPKKAVAIAAFATALTGSLIAMPALFDNQAFALDADPGAPDKPSWHRPLPSEMIEARLAYIKTALKITDAETRQWNAVADVLRKQAKDRDAMVTTMRAYRDTKLTAIDGLQRRQKMMEQGAADLAELIAAAQPLYASFSDDQKRLADDLLARPFHGGHDGGGHDGGGHDGDGPGWHGPQHGPVRP